MKGLKSSCCQSRVGDGGSCDGESVRCVGRSLSQFRVSDGAVSSLRCGKQSRPHYGGMGWTAGWRRECTFCGKGVILGLRCVGRSRRLECV